MNISYFIAQRLRKKQDKSFSSTVSTIGIASVALSLATMIISFAILKGFQHNIREKLFSFGGHIVVKQYALDNSYEEHPISTNTNLYKNYKKTLPEIQNIQQFSMKAGLLKTDNDLLGILYKGVGKDFNINQFKSSIIDGSFISFPDTSVSKEIIISQNIANKLNLKVKDNIIIYFMQDPPRAKKLTIKGIYETDMEEFDEKIIIGDIRLIKQLNAWADTLTGGYEIFLKNFDDLEIVSSEIEKVKDYDMEVIKSTDRFESVFDWLSLLNRNVAIFLSLILFVAGFNMISILIILIMERTQMIGLLKAFGATNIQIRDVFIWNANNLIIKGLFWGNVIGIGFCSIQYYFHLIPLDRHNYYMEYVPITWDWQIIILLNIAVILLISAILLLPTLLISRIQPVKSIRFD